MMVRQNKWRAARYGMQAKLVDSFTFEPHPARDVVQHLVRLLRPAAEELECMPYLERVLEMARSGTWADRQLDVLRETGDPRKVVERMTARSRLTAPA
jgi:carboxylate-amine ligase